MFPDKTDDVPFLIDHVRFKTLPFDAFQLESFIENSRCLSSDGGACVSFSKCDQLTTGHAQGILARLGFNLSNLLLDDICEGHLRRTFVFRVPTNLNYRLTCPICYHDLSINAVTTDVSCPSCFFERD